MNESSLDYHYAEERRPARAKVHEGAACRTLWAAVLKQAVDDAHGVIKTGATSTTRRIARAAWCGR